MSLLHGSWGGKCQELPRWPEFENKFISRKGAFCGCTTEHDNLVLFAEFASNASWKLSGGFDAGPLLGKIAKHLLCECSVHLRLKDCIVDR